MVRHGLDVVRRSVEQLAAKQDQMAQNIATLQTVEEDIRQKMSYTPPSPSQQAASIPQPKPPQPRAQSSAVQSSSVIARRLRPDPLYSRDDVNTKTQISTERSSVAIRGKADVART
jgi:type IV secretory pathway VirB10-like protein